MAGMRLSDLDFVRLLPAFMQGDEAVMALSKAINRLLGEPCERLDTIRTWDKIDELNEAECDELAWELDVDWYDSAGMTIEEKRETIKLAQQIKRKRGTKWAVERLIDTYIGEGHVVEWYELSAENPYTFMILTTSTDVTADNYAKFVEATDYAKNERSHIVGIYYFWEQAADVEYAPEQRTHHYALDKCGTRYRPATVGGLMKLSVETEPQESRYLYSFPECGADGYKAKVGAAIVGTAIAGRAIATN